MKCQNDRCRNDLPEGSTRRRKYCCATCRVDAARRRRYQAEREAAAHEAEREREEWSAAMRVAGPQAEALLRQLYHWGPRELITGILVSVHDYAHTDDGRQTDAVDAPAVARIRARLTRWAEGR